ncbi:CvpA family protein [uncultured Eudoraea sp.]|uniref:CvpA family protein n=1 Tax=uncultured Eudoraea sp. TaxID=1035614 RepID=UPI00260A89A0|nr:CvpA family protein [uncultured Eudoraea sp.]
MNILDIILGLFLVYGLYKGLKNGLFVEIASLAAIIIGLYGAIKFSYLTGSYLSQNMDWNENYIKIAAFIITFLAIVILVNMAGKILTKIADFAMLGLLNKIAGGLFGILKTAVILGTLLYFIESASSSFNLIENNTVKESVLYKPVRDIGALVFGNIIEVFQDG